MSVIRSKRGESSVQFLDTARNLFKFTKQQCVRLPKRYTFFGTQQTYACASQIMENVKMGNSIYPTNEHEVQMRRDYFLKALAEINVLLEYIYDIKESFPISDTVMLEWLKMATEEIRLIKGVLSKDKDRYTKAKLIT